MTTNALARLIVERAIRENKLTVTPDQQTKATYDLLVWIENQTVGFNGDEADKRAVALLAHHESR